MGYLINPPANQAGYFVENSAYLKNYLTDLLRDLEFIEETSHYHPEKNTLNHSLQVFELAYQATKDPELWAAALLHDIGKAIDYPQHAIVGAELLHHLLSPRIVWLVKHHLDLLKQPKRTRHKLANTTQLFDLEQLKRWDMDGRVPHKKTGTIEFAIQQIFQYEHLIIQS